MEGQYQHNPSRDSLAVARKHVRALTDGGVSREALLRALLEEQEGARNHELPPLPLKSNSPSLSRSQSQSHSLSRSQSNTPSLSRSRSQAHHPRSHSPSPLPLGSHWSSSTTAAKSNEPGRPHVSGHQSRLSTSTSNSESKSIGKNSTVSDQTSATSIESSRSSTLTQFPGAELFLNRPVTTSTRAYWCTSCDTEFKRKFDWKRHEDEFHERYKKYPCPDCNRVFWGANTFNQHHKTRHNCKTCPHSEKVIKYTRRKRAWACGFCAAFLPSMDRYIDHIGLHFEAGRTKAHWFHSNVIYGLLHQPGINEAWKTVIAARFGHLPKEQQPHYGWDPKVTGRKQGFLENESAGQLQDLLEFYNPAKDDPAKIARLAFEQTELTKETNSLRINSGRPSQEEQPPPVPKRDKAKKRGPSGIQRELSPPPARKERPATQWPSHMEMPGIAEVPDSETGSNVGVDMAQAEPCMHQTDFDSAAIPPPLFGQSPPPHSSLHPPPQYARPQSVNTTSDPPAYASPIKFSSGLPRDTVMDLLANYMGNDQSHDGDDMVPPLPQPPHQFGQYNDWSSLCDTMVNDVPSPRHGPPLPAAPQERPTRGSDVWAANGTESYYPATPQDAYDIPSYGVTGKHGLPPLPPTIGGQQHQSRRSDVWATTNNINVNTQHHNNTGNSGAERLQPPPPLGSNLQHEVRLSDIWGSGSMEVNTNQHNTSGDSSAHDLQQQALSNGQQHQQHQPGQHPCRSDVWAATGTEPYYDNMNMDSPSLEDTSHGSRSDGLQPPPKFPKGPSPRRSDVWAATGTESFYDDSVDIDSPVVENGSHDSGGESLRPPRFTNGPPPRRSDVWASMGTGDYDGHDYEEEVAHGPPPVNWL